MTRTAKKILLEMDTRWAQVEHEIRRLRELDGLLSKELERRKRKPRPPQPRYIPNE